MKNLLLIIFSLGLILSCNTQGSNNTSTSKDNDVKDKEVATATTSTSDDQDLVAEGKSLLEKNGCLACHSITGEKIVGPTLKGLYGSEVKVMTEGKERTTTVDDEYIKTAIYDPDHDVPDGYQKGQMISYKSTINDDQLKAMIAYMKTLK
ncbi:MAG: cytochrome c family protein [Bacteroidales bacterium]